MSGADVPALVLGYGSIGRRHARALASRGHALAIVNRRSEVRAQAKADHPAALVAESVEELDRLGFQWDSAVAVIATWGPGHAEHLCQLANRGVRRVLCEKPMATSVADARAMVITGGALDYAGCNHTLRFARLAGAVNALAGAHRLGEPVALVVQGGAACLVTNGIHWLDFGTQLFGAAPVSVTSTAMGAPINPRSPELSLFGGTAVWSYPGDRETVVTFSNGASLVPSARVLYRDAAMELGYVGVGADSVLHVRLDTREPEAIARFPQVTRTGPVSVRRFEGPVPGALTFNEGLDVAVAELAEGSSPTCSLAVGAAAVEHTVGALEAGRESRRVSFGDRRAEWHATQWPMS